MKGKTWLFALSALLAVSPVCGCKGKTPAPKPAPADPPLPEEGMTAAVLADTDDVLINPGKGFVYYGGAYEELKELSYLYAVGYHRFSWSDLETADGVYNFDKLEKSWRGYFQKVGRKFAFGVMSVNTSSTEEYITPQFVFERSGKYDLHHFLDGGEEKVQYIPKWDDDVYLEEAAEFAAELGRRYNGQEDIAFVDILTYGNWGEQHLFGLETGIENYSEKGKVSPAFFRDRYIKPYIEAFPDTLLYNTWGYDDLNGVYRELMEERVSVRRNGIISYTNGLDMLAEAYGKLPVAFEFARGYDHYAEDPERGGAYFNQKLEEAIAIAKPSYIELDVDWYRANKEYCEELANRMGYYFRLKRAWYKEELAGETEVILEFRNDGITPVYEPCYVVLALLDGEGRAVKKYATDIDPKAWLPGTASQENVTITAEDVPAGEYRIAAGLFESLDDELPAYLLGSEGGTADKWYVFGNVTVS